MTNLLSDGYKQAESITVCVFTIILTKCATYIYILERLNTFLNLNSHNWQEKPGTDVV